MIDFHCHLDLYSDFERRFKETSDHQILAVTTTPFAWQTNVDLAPANVRVALGIHPQLVGEREASMDKFRSLIPKARFVGEIGLDRGPAFYKTIDQQKEVFYEVLQLSDCHSPKILSIHSVRAAPEVLGGLESFFPNSAGKAILHWFTGARCELRRAIEYDCWFSINSKMLTSEKGRMLISEMPLERILPETDGPFIQSANGTLVSPGAVGPVCVEFAKLRGMTVAEVESVFRANLKELES